MHTSYCIGSIFSLNNWFAVRVKPASKFPLQLFGDKLRLSIVMVPRVVAVTKNHITKFDLEKEERIRDKTNAKGRIDKLCPLFLPLIILHKSVHLHQLE